MSHLDEGIIHAWLDGALPPDEAARVEAHASTCAECAALVAEARGFIAGASRIVSSLDVVRGNVIPTATPEKMTTSMSLWRRLKLSPTSASIAAALLVGVASMFAVRHQNATYETSAARADTILALRTAPLAATGAPAPAPVMSTAVPATKPSAPPPAARQTAERVMAQASDTNGSSAGARAEATRDLAAERAKVAVVVPGTSAPAGAAASAPAAAPAVASSTSNAMSNATSNAGVAAASAPATADARDVKAVAREAVVDAVNRAAAASAGSAPASAARGFAADSAARRARGGVLGDVSPVEGCYEILRRLLLPDLHGFPAQFRLTHDSTNRNVVLPMNLPGRFGPPVEGARWQVLPGNSVVITAIGNHGGQIDLQFFAGDTLIRLSDGTRPPPIRLATRTCGR